MGRASNQFSSDEILLMSDIMERLLQGKPLNDAVKHGSFASVYRKTITMKNRIAHLKTKKEEEDEDEP